MIGHLTLLEVSVLRCLVLHASYDKQGAKTPRANPQNSRVATCADPSHRALTELAGNNLCLVVSALVLACVEAPFVDSKDPRVIVAATVALLWCVVVWRAKVMLVYKRLHGGNNKQPTRKSDYFIYTKRICQAFRSITPHDGFVLYR